MPRVTRTFFIFLLLPVMGAAQDEPLTLADDPLEITDSLAASPGEAELSFVGIYGRARRGRYRATVALQSEYCRREVSHRVTEPAVGVAH